MLLQLTSSIWRGAPSVRLYDMLQLQRSSKVYWPAAVACRVALCAFWRACRPAKQGVLGFLCQRRFLP